MSENSMHYNLSVAVEAEGERLDRYVARAVPELSRSYVQQLIAAEQITVNARPARASLALRAGDQVAVAVPPPQPIGLAPEAIPLDVVYEDADVVVVNKPAGMVVHPAPGHPGGTLVNALLARYPDMQVAGDLRPGIVHRIDAGTSGLLVVARNDAALRDLADQQRERQMRKIYLAVAEGRVKEPEGVVDAPVGRHPVDRLRMAVVRGGRPARTHYRVIEELDAYTLLELRLETGRTHQIRVHMLHIGRPVLGDPIYGARKGRPSFGLDRQFLHAQQLGFRLPGGGWREFSAPLPADLEAALRKLRGSSR
ncbi:RluA family pseudouridine synthase [Oscillochloris sp. ZM17-4]|uniref:RluA family pseudouridine synthase n=1 Tax=Oscillochloris sp. ZM17-4 TaxID=2866714 RepID=UPI001C7368FE|nr:RluA family pseudouridine synthase [Oscillochloris sp. ZM17-4]MBX0330329.1 RluA family pseudouridine synthase [Oscillochloris sp. ZM17-4]